VNEVFPGLKLNEHEPHPKDAAVENASDLEMPAQKPGPVTFFYSRTALPMPDAAPDHSAPVQLLQLQDELARSRLRESFWISLVVHLLAVITLVASPKMFPRFWGPPVAVATPADLLRNRELTYLDMPQDRQKPPATPPKSNIISDKNRIAMSRRPTLDRQELRKILDSARPGAPGAGGANAPAAPPQLTMPQQGQPEQSAPSNTPSQPAPTQTAQLETPANRPGRGVKFGSTTMSPGSLIEQATRGAAASRGGGGVGGDFGTAPDGGGKVGSDLDIMSDTMGVDFGPYLSRVLHDVRQNWYLLIPEIARPPLMKRGKVSIEFAIMKDGRVNGLRIISQSGDVSLDRAAYGGISASNPFPPLPSEFRGDYLALRFHFYYNPDKSEMH